MKRKAYYQVHKNKRPRAKKNKRYKSVMFPMLAINAAVSCAQIGIQQSQWGSSAQIKAIGIAETVFNAATSMINIVKTEPLRRYKATGRYGKIKH